MAGEQYVLLFLAGVLCGGINAIAGGATLIGFPVLLSVGLAPQVANASNFLATMPGYAAAIPAYFKELASFGRSSIVLVALAVAAGGAGSLLLIYSPGDFFVKLTPYLLLSATLIYGFGAHLNRLLRRLSKREDMRDSFVGRCCVVLFSVYGGYFGAGLGIIVLALLDALGVGDYHRANALKNVMVTAVSLVSIGIFISAGLVHWPAALTMMCGATIGGYVSIRYARFMPQRLLRLSIILLGLFFSLYYFIQQYV
ncbi:MAG: sulfite exporter TauE/SafE family protein [Pseudomonadales bacterium]